MTSSENAVFRVFKDDACIPRSGLLIRFCLQKYKQVTDKVCCPHDKFCPVSYCHSNLGARIKSWCICKSKAVLFECDFLGNYTFYYLNTTENSLTHNFLHTTTKKTHSIQSTCKRQIILCLPQNYCLAIHEIPLKSICSCAKNTADRELLPPSPKTLYLHLLFSTWLWTRPSLLSSFSRQVRMRHN